MHPESEFVVNATMINTFQALKWYMTKHFVSMIILIPLGLRRVVCKLSCCLIEFYTLVLR